MAEIAIPEPFAAALSALERLDDAQAATLMRTVAEQGSFLQVAELRAAVMTAFPEEERDTAETLVPALIGLRGSLRSAMPADEMAAMVSRSSGLAMMSDEQRARLGERLLPLLGSPAIATTAGAVELLTQHPRNFQSARVLTDIRPVFAEDPTTIPKGVVVVDTLQVRTWNRDGESETFNVTMDAVDLVNLREVIDRALAKTKTVRTMMASQGVTTFEMDKEDQ